MASLDTAIVNVAAPQIQHDLHMSIGALQLAVYAYLLTYAAGLITAARLGARRGYGSVFTAGVALFTASSMACGFAPDPAVLVAARTAQGLGAALMVAQVLSLLQTALEGERRRRALNLYGLVLAGGVAAGQVLGGALAGANLLGTGWRPIFLVNVPIGVGVLLLAAGGRLPAGTPARTARLDLSGALALACATLALLIPLSLGAAAAWPDWIWPSFTAGAVLLAWFARHVRRLTRRGGDPLIDPALLANTRVRTPLAGIFVLMGCYGGLLFTTTLFLQGALHESPLRSGVTFAAYALGFASASMTWTKLPATFHPHIPAVSFTLLASCTGLLASSTRAAWPWYATVLLAGAGIAHGAGFSALVRRASAAASARHTASFSGVLATVIQLAIAAGIAIAGTLYLVLPRHLGHGSALSPVLLTLAGAEALAGLILSPALARRAGTTTRC
jgi:MFS family permease